MLRNHQKNLRNIKFYILEKKKYILYEFFRLSFGIKIVLFGSTLSFFGLFFPWIKSLDNTSLLPTKSLSVNAFSQLSGYVGFFLFFLLIFLVFFIFSQKQTSFFKQYISLKISLSQGVLIIFFIAIFSIFQSFSYIYSYQLFSSNIIYGNGYVITTTGFFMILLGYYFLRAQKNIHVSHSSYSYEKEVPMVGENISESLKDNMKLPF